MFFRSDALSNLPLRYHLEKQQVWPLVVNEAKWVIAVLPDLHMAHVTLAEALLHLGNRQQAIEAFRDYLALEPEDNEIAQRLAEVELQR